MSIGGEQLSEGTPRLDGICRQLAGLLGTELLELLWIRNGFYAFESALHVFPVATSGAIVSLDGWNSLESWRWDYGDLTRDCLFFAQDLVGGQFCVFENAVYKFDPETGDKTLLGHSLDDWAGAILRDHERLTLSPFGHEWQEKHGALPSGKRLAPKTPFVLGGEYSIDNLYLADGEKLMRFYANVAHQIRHLPDGAGVELKVID